MKFRELIKKHIVVYGSEGVLSSSICRDKILIAIESNSKLRVQLLYALVTHHFLTEQLFDNISLHLCLIEKLLLMYSAWLSKYRLLIHTTCSQRLQRWICSSFGLDLTLNLISLPDHEVVRLISIARRQRW